MFLEKSKELKIHTLDYGDGLHCIQIDNLGIRQETMAKASIITKEFAQGEEFYFGFFRYDGSFSSGEEIQKYMKEIPEYLSEHGKYEQFVHTIQRRHKVKVINDDHIAACLPVNEGTYQMLPIFFNFYLDTIYFCPKVGWEVFVESYRDYMKHGGIGYINNFTDFLFEYSDSGDFSVSFNSNLYDKTKVYNRIMEIMDDVISEYKMGEGYYPHL